MNDKVIEATFEEVKEEPFKVELIKLVKITSGGMHGWYQSNVGLIRKPLRNLGI